MRQQVLWLLPEGWSAVKESGAAMNKEELHADSTASLYSSVVSPDDGLTCFSCVSGNQQAVFLPACAQHDPLPCIQRQTHHRNCDTLMCCTAINRQLDGLLAWRRQGATIPGNLLSSSSAAWLTTATGPAGWPSGPSCVPTSAAAVGSGSSWLALSPTKMSAVAYRLRDQTNLRVGGGAGGHVVQLEPTRCLRWPLNCVPTSAAAAGSCSVLTGLLGRRRCQPWHIGYATTPTCMPGRLLW
jgi:hypothetical protein